MKYEIWQYFVDRINIILISIAFIFGAILLYLIRLQSFSGGDLPPLISFAKVDIFVIFIFAVNLILGAVSYNREKHISYIFSGLTVFCLLLFLLAILLRLVNPDG